MVTLKGKADAKTFEPFFIQYGEVGVENFRKQVELVVETISNVFQGVEHPFEGLTINEIKQDLRPVMSIPKNPQSLPQVLKEIESNIINNSLHISHERSMAHLHCPPVITGILAELIIGTLNQSMDSWDQSPTATYVEEELTRYMSNLISFPGEADGVFTSGGTQSNFMGLLIARDVFCLTKWNHSVKKRGLPDQFKKMKILCSEEAHFSVKKAVSQLGLGEQAVVPIRVDQYHRIDLKEFTRTVKGLKEEGYLPYAVVATCGTTDYGSIDPLEGLADLCAEEGMWLHVDAAYGAGLLFSEKNSYKVEGLARADSVALDFHKWMFQPISCGMFLVKNRKYMRTLSHHADYLNPIKDEGDGILNLVNKSIQTTRRFDALKVLLTLKVIGTRILGNMVDRTIELAWYAAGELEKREVFHVENESPGLSTVVFQYRPYSNHPTGELNRKIQQKLFQKGTAVISKTSVSGETFLKFTLLNPRTSEQDVVDVINEIEKIAQTLIEGGTPQ